MIETKEFNGWTEYDDWLSQHYGEIGVVKVDEVDGIIKVDMMPKAEWDVEAKKLAEQHEEEIRAADAERAAKKAARKAAASAQNTAPTA